MRSLLPMALAAAVHAAAPEVAPPDAEAVLAKLDDLYRSTASIARMELTVTGARAVRTLRLAAWTRGEDEALIVVEAPPREAGIATLKVKDNLWNYLPRVARTIRVPPSMMLGSWMGTDFTNDDLVRESSYRKDFVSRVDGRSDGGRGWRLLLEVKPGVVGRWARIEVHVDDELLPTKMLFFDRKARHARTMAFDEVRELGGRRLPARMSMTPADTEGQRTELRYLEVRFDAEVPDETFSLSRLEQNR